ncbi:MAG TPA: PIG-L family deacetylase [Candidatus Xenobia bacterium]
MPELQAPYPDLPAFEGTVLAVFAHADDELGVAAQLSVMGAQVRWILVSDNRGRFARKGNERAELRWNEVCRAAAALGLREPVPLGQPDGGLHSLDLASLLTPFLEPSVGAVVTHDVCGLYGHPDHLAVRDAMASLVRGTNIPLVSQALPAAFRRWVPLRRAARGRQRAPITHKFDMSPEMQGRKTAATLAHESQRHIFFALMQGRSPAAFYRAFPREFLTLEVIE